MKICTKCLEEKPLTYFGKHKQGKNGLHPWCKECTGIKNAEWQKNNLSKFRDYSAKYKANNKEKVLEAARIWRSANPEKTKKIAYNWKQKNRHRIAAVMAIWRAKNRDLKRIYDQNRRAKKAASGGSLSKDIAHKLLIAQKGRCACCKILLVDNYHLDHIIPLARNGSHENSNIQLLCPHCNCSKGSKDPIDFMKSRGFLL